METENLVAVAVEFAELSAQIRADGPVIDQLHRVADLALTHTPGCTSTSIAELAPSKCRSLVVSDAVAGQLDSLQYEVGQGPSFDAVADNECIVISQDVAAEVRWPLLVTRVRAELPIRSLLSIQMIGHERTTMNFYAETSGVFDEAAVAIANIITAQAAILLAVSTAAQHSRNLSDALASNRQIGMAMGVLMGQHKITSDEAFTMLRTASQGLHRKLRDIATEVTETGLLPSVPAGSVAAATASTG